MKELQRRGVDTTCPIPDKEYEKARLYIRGSKEIVYDALQIVKSEIKSKIGLTVSKEKRDFNLSICRKNTCESHGYLKSGADVCHRCNCKDGGLMLLLQEQGKSCPAGLWTNE